MEVEYVYDVLQMHYMLDLELHMRILACSRCRRAWVTFDCCRAPWQGLVYEQQMMNWDIQILVLLLINGHFNSLLCSHSEKLH